MQPGEIMKAFILSYVAEQKLDEHLKSELPKKWEKYGDFVLFDERTFSSEAWKSQGLSFWEKIAEILKCKRLGVKNKITNDGFRTPNVSILLGQDPWTLHKDNGITYTWNVERSMFSAGNATERHRIAKFDCQNEVVVDLFAGIGYFTLPFIVHANASFVHACEWNPVAVEALKRNLKLNKVMDKCQIHEGDNRVMCPKNVGNRVNLGLIPSSLEFLEIACDALVEEGGILHIHENVEIKKFKVDCNECGLLHDRILQLCENQQTKCLMMTMDKSEILESGEISINWKHREWLLKGIHIIHSLLTILPSVKSEGIWWCTIEGVNCVKSYAPNVHHVVYDVRVSSSSSR